MKILLVGEYSRLHNSLKYGLEKLGHEVTLVATGDGFKQFPADIKLKKLFTKGFFKKVKVAWFKVFGQDLTSLSLTKELLSNKKKLQGFDVVQLINECPLGGQPKYEWEAIEFLKTHNEKLFVLSCGTDYPSVTYAHNKIPKYSILTPFFEGKLTEAQVQPMLKYLDKDHKDLHVKLTVACNGYIASDLDYHLPLQENPKYLGLAPNPIITEDFEFCLAPVKDKVVIFHGINRAAYYKKGSDLFQKALKKVHATHGDQIEIVTVESLPYAEYIKAYDRAHIMLDQVYSYDQGFNALEAMAKGKVVFTGAEPIFLDHYHLEDKQVAINATPDVEQLVTDLIWLIENPKQIESIGKAAREFVLKHHEAKKSAQHYVSLWTS